jgi:hypothetical protein
MAQKAAKISEEHGKKTEALYIKLKEKSVSCYCRLLKRHPHFNYRLNIIQALMPKIADFDAPVRQLVTRTVHEVLHIEDNGLLSFKLDVLKELHKALKKVKHEFVEPYLLDCLVLHEIMVDEQKAKAIDESTKKSTQLHD